MILPKMKYIEKFTLLIEIKLTVKLTFLEAHLKQREKKMVNSEKRLSYLLVTFINGN